MDSIFDSARLKVSRIGRLAARILDRNAEGRVLAVFNSSFYVEMPDGLVCIGHERIGDSPLNLLVLTPRNMDWQASGIRRDARLINSTGTIRIGNRFLFDCRNAAVVRSVRPPRNWWAEDLENGLAMLRAASDGRIPRDGLGAFIRRSNEPDGDSTLCKAAAEPVKDMRRWLASSLMNGPQGAENKPGWVRGLLGLGPGLTPSGDDFVAGAMIALCSLGEHRLYRLLWETAQPIADSSGNRISLAHLEAAAEGFASPAIQRAIVGLLTADRLLLLDAINAIDGIGHTSGWDAMAGIVQTFDVWLQVRKAPFAPRHGIVKFQNSLQ